MTRTALVLGGGGITGIAWELGILQGLAEQGLKLTDADRVVGTSAGSVVGAQITSGLAARRPVRPPARAPGPRDRLHDGPHRPGPAAASAAGARRADPQAPTDRPPVHQGAHARGRGADRGDPVPDRGHRLARPGAAHHLGRHRLRRVRHLRQEQRRRPRRRRRGELRGPPGLARGDDPRSALHGRRHAVDGQRRRGPRRRRRRGAGAAAAGLQPGHLDRRAAAPHRPGPVGGGQARQAGGPRHRAQRAQPRRSAPTRPAPACASPATVAAQVRAVWPH